VEWYEKLYKEVYLTSVRDKELHLG
jgi:hypothetical protein